MSVLRIATLQTPAPDFATAEQAWAELLARVDDAAQDEPDLVVLPEAAYPAWFLGAAAGTPPVLHDTQVLGDLAERARQHGVHIAAGLVLGRPEAPQNAAVLLSPDGVELARAAEAYPASWFRAGSGPAGATIGGVDVALFAGSDHLDPRWVEAIADAGTRLCIATGAARGWPLRGAASGEVPGDVAGFVVPGRAAETGAWFAVPGRVGVEADSVGYAGGAGVASPRDGWVARAPSDRPGIVMYACELTPASPSPAPPAATTPAPPRPPAHAEGGPLLVATLALDPSPSVVELMESVRAAVRAATTLGAALVVLPDLTGPDPRAVSHAETLPLIEEVSAESHVTVLASAASREGGVVRRSIAVVDDGRLLAMHHQSVLSPADRAAGFTPGADAPPVVATRAGALGVLGGAEGMLPSLAADLRRGGAQVVAWCAGHDDRLVAEVSRTRAWEQRLPVVAASPVAGGSYVVDAGGTVIAATQPGTAMLAHGRVERPTLGVL